MPVVTITWQLGSGGAEVAAEVAQLLGVRLVDRELLVLASERTGIPVEALESLDERGRNMLTRPADLVQLVPLPPIDPGMSDVTGDRYPPTGPVLARGQGLVSPKYWAAEAYSTLMARTIQRVAAEGDAVVVGRAGNEALAGQPGVLRALVAGNEANRIRRVMEAKRIDAYDARDLVRESDSDRSAYVRQFFHAEWLDPERYDLVVNTDHVPPAAAAATIAAAAREAASGVSAAAPAPGETVAAHA
jgi:cytidylate kinase